MLTNQEIHKFKSALDAERTKLEKEIADLTKVTDMGSDVDAFDEETDEAEEFSQNQGAAQALKQRHIEVKEALDRIAAGSYGKCQSCGMEIEKEVLEVNPESRFCRSCNKGK